MILGSCIPYLFCFWKVLISSPGISPDDEKPKPHGSSGKAPAEAKETQRLDRIAHPGKWKGSPWTALQILILGVLSPDYALWSCLSAFKNVVLTVMALDMVVRGPLYYPSHDLSFIRTGYVSDTSAMILVREPDPSRLPLEIKYREPSDSRTAESLVWATAGKIMFTKEEQDYTAPTKITGLKPSLRYVVSSSNGHAVEFETTPPAGSVNPQIKKFAFLTTSCIKPRFPFNPFDHPLAVPGLDHLARLIPQLGASFMLFLGDFIYIDVPHRFGFSPATYRAEYRRVYASPSWPAAARTLPWIHVIDDHEIANDWDQGLSDPYPAAIDPFTVYHHAVNPPSALPNSTAYVFTHGPATFFLLDTRRHRTPSAGAPPASSKKTMLGAEQLAALLAWLRRPEPAGVRFKFIVSSVPLTRNWRVNAADTWAGYLHERQTILEAAWDMVTARPHLGVVVLSGDRHEFAATRFPAPAGAKGGTGGKRWAEETSVMEFSCSPLSMFYLPFQTYWEVPGEESGVGAGGEDRRVEYIPAGNSKFGAVEIEGGVHGMAKGQAVLKYRLFVDGKERWRYTLTTGS